MSIIILQHGEHVPAARIGSVLRSNGLKLQRLRIDLPADQGGDELPGDLNDISGVIAMGGPQMPDEDLPYLLREMDLIRMAHEAGLPVVGICLGAQLIARALGGEVARLETPEFGFMPVNQTPPGNTDTILAGIPWTMHQYQSHWYHIKTPPPGATVLQTSDAAVQCFRIGLRTYAFQYHFELDRPLMEVLALRNPDKLEASGLSLEDLQSQIDQYGDAYARLSTRICSNLAQYLFALTPHARV